MSSENYVTAQGEQVIGKLWKKVKKKTKMTTGIQKPLQAV